MTVRVMKSYSLVLSSRCAASLSSIAAVAAAEGDDVVDGESKVMSLKATKCGA